MSVPSAVSRRVPPGRRPIARAVLVFAIAAALSWVPASVRAHDQLRSHSAPALAFSKSGDSPPQKVSVEGATVLALLHAAAFQTGHEAVLAPPSRPTATAPHVDRESPRGPPSVRS